MAKSDATELDILAYIFQGVAPSWAAEANLFAALHESSPGDAGDQTTGEADYTGYTRVTVSRSSTAWTYSSTTLMANVAPITFPECTGGNNTITHISIGSSFSGAGQLFYHGATTATLNVSNGITPTVNTQSITISED